MGRAASLACRPNAQNSKLIWTLGVDFDYPFEVRPRFLSSEGAAGRF
jgi:hypothetical protein